MTSEIDANTAALTPTEKAAALHNLRSTLLPRPHSPNLNPSPPSSSIIATCSAPSPTIAPLNLIGRGTCGRVYTQPSSAFVWKQAVSQSWEQNLAYENELQKRTFRVFEETRAALVDDGKEWELPLVPDAFEYMERPSPALLEAGQAGAGIPRGSEVDAHLSVRRSDRIFPIPRGTREAIIDLFSPEQSTVAKTREWRALQKAHRGNEDAIVRVYLGRAGGRESRKGFSVLTTWGLRNFGLDRGMLVRALPRPQVNNAGTEDIDMTPLLSLARQMARALAISHHLLHNDANDVEFVLGCTSLTSSETRLWMLDFDKVRPLPDRRTMMRESVTLAAKSVDENDPYFCQPPAVESAVGEDGVDEEDRRVVEELWKAQRDAYEEMSEWIARRMEDQEEAEVVMTWTREFVSALEEGAWSS